MDDAGRKPGSGGLRVMFLMQTLGYGGAERQMVTLARRLHERGHAISVTVFYPNGPLEPELRAAGIPVHILGKKHRWDMAGFSRRLTNSIRRERPDILHSYLQVPNLICALLKPLFPKLRVVWGVRGSYIDLSRYDRFVRLTYRVEPKLARFADRIIANSQSGRQWAVSQGFPASRLCVIPNGIDTARFRPDATERERVRAEWGIGPEQTLIGLVARLDPIKDHENFVRAAAQLAHTRPEVRFVCVGEQPHAAHAAKLHELASELGLADKLRWSPPRHDTPAVYNAFDVATLTSYGEGFPNVIGEAMASGVPCVVTDAGDAAWIVGECGTVVPCRNPDALANGYAALLDRSEAARQEVGQAARQRIVTMFSVESLTEQTETALCAAMGKKRRRSST